MENHLKFIKDNTDDTKRNKFNTLEYEKFRRVVDYMKKTTYSTEKLKEGRKDFWNFFKEQDRRRKNNFEKTFPEMQSFFNLCKETANE